MDVLKVKMEQIENRLSDVSNERISHIEERLEKICSQLEKTNKQSKKNKKIIASFKSSTVNPLDTQYENNLSAIKQEQESEKKLNVSQKWATVFKNVHERHLHEQQDSNNKKRLENIKMSAEKFISSLSVHGVSRIVKTNSVVIRVVWTIMILISVSFGLYTISRSINDFNQNDVITNVDRIHPKSATFPAITICKKDYFRYRRNTCTNNSTSPTFEYFNIYNKSIDLILRDLRFKDESYDTRNDNSEIEYFKIPKTFGDCVRFNGFAGKDLKTSEFKTDAFQLRLLHSYSKSRLDVYNIFNEIEVYVTDNYLNSFLNSDPMHLDTGKEYLVSLIKTESEIKLGQPFNNCTETNDVTYRQVNCIEKCINREMGDKYNCSIPSYYRVGGLGECGGELKGHEISNKEFNNNNWICDTYEKHMTFLKNFTNEFSAVCEKECPRECETSLFQAQVITSSSSDTRFSFSFSDFSTLTIKQIPKMNSYSLLASIGGSLGLFIGIRFLSLVEFLEFLIDIVFAVYIPKN